MGWMRSDKKRKLFAILFVSIIFLLLLRNWKRGDAKIAFVDKVFFLFLSNKAKRDADKMLINNKIT